MNVINIANKSLDYIDCNNEKQMNTNNIIETFPEYQKMKKDVEVANMKVTKEQNEKADLSSEIVAYKLQISELQTARKKLNEILKKADQKLEAYEAKGTKLQTEIEKLQNENIQYRIQLCEQETKMKSALELQTLKATM